MSSQVVVEVAIGLWLAIMSLGFVSYNVSVKVAERLIWVRIALLLLQVGLLAYVLRSRW